MYICENTVKITEADNSNDIIDYPHNDKPRTSTGIFRVFVMLYSLLLYH